MCRAAGHIKNPIRTLCRMSYMIRHSDVVPTFHHVTICFYYYFYNREELRGNVQTPAILLARPNTCVTCLFCREVMSNSNRMFSFSFGDIASFSSWPLAIKKVLILDKITLLLAMSLVRRIQRMTMTSPLPLSLSQIRSTHTQFEPPERTKAR